MLKGKLKGDECDLERGLPLYCEQLINQEGDQLDNWLSAFYSTQSISEHHGKTMELV